MIVALPFSHRDLTAALRLIRWIHFLAQQSPHTGLPQLLLVASPTAQYVAGYEDIQAAVKAMRDNGWSLFPMATLKEDGWPHAPNQMFQYCLRLCQGQDMLFLEPDVVPMSVDWFKRIQEAWQKAKGKTFMGGFVHHHKPHMTGIAVYGKEAMHVAPRLLTATSEAWDTWAADEILLHAELTPLIFQIFGNPQIHSLEQIPPYTALFHQNKTGSLIKILDDVAFRGEFQEMYRHARSALPMPRYFHKEPSNMASKAGGMSIAFDSYEQFNGVWRGILAPEDPEVIAVLDMLIRTPSSGVREIDQAEYDACLKKKETLLGAPKPVQRRVSLRPEAARIEARPAVVVESPASIPEPDKIADVESAVTTGRVEGTSLEPPQPPAKPKKKR